MIHDPSEIFSKYFFMIHDPSEISPKYFFMIRDPSEISPGVEMTVEAVRMRSVTSKELSNDALTTTEKSPFYWAGMFNAGGLYTFLQTSSWRVSAEYYQAG